MNGHNNTRKASQSEINGSTNGMITTHRAYTADITRAPHGYMLCKTIVLK